MKLKINQRQTAHLVEPSPWPMQMSIVLGTLLLGIGIFLMNKTSKELIGGILILIYWLSEIIKQEVNLVEPTSRLKEMTKVLGPLLVFIIIQGILIENTVYMMGEDSNENNLINTKRNNIEEKIIEIIIIFIIFFPIGIIIGSIKKLNRITDWINENFYKIIFILITLYIILLFIRYLPPILLAGEEEEGIKKITEKIKNILESNEGIGSIIENSSWFNNLFYYVLPSSNFSSIENLVWELMITVGACLFLLLQFLIIYTIRYFLNKINKDLLFLNKLPIKNTNWIRKYILYTIYCYNQSTKYFIYIYIIFLIFTLLITTLGLLEIYVYIDLFLNQHNEVYNIIKK